MGDLKDYWRDERAKKVPSASVWRKYSTRCPNCDCVVSPQGTGTGNHPVRCPQCDRPSMCRECDYVLSLADNPICKMCSDEVTDENVTHHNTSSETPHTLATVLNAPLPASDGLHETGLDAVRHNANRLHPSDDCRSCSNMISQNNPRLACHQCQVEFVCQACYSARPDGQSYP